MIARRYLALPVVFLAALSLLILSSSPAEAVAPPNDSFGFHTVMNLGTTQFVDTTDATFPEAGEPTPGCQASFGKSVWYRYNAPANATVTVNTDGSSFDTVVAVYRATVQFPLITNLVQVGCDDDGGVAQASQTTFPVLAGASYFIQAGGFNGASGSLLLGLGQIPANDNLAAAITATPPFLALVNNTLAIDEGGEPTSSCLVQHAVWYKATLSPGSYVAQNVQNIGLDPSLAIYTGPAVSPTFPGLVPVDCNDDYFGISSQINFIVASPATYYFQAGGLGGTEGEFTFILNVTPDSDGDGVANQNDNCPATPNGPLQTYIFGLGNQYDNDGDGLPGTQPPFNATWGGDACDVDDDDDDVLDTTDGCRTSPEDSDNWQDGDGCEDPDNDSDGICDTGLVSISCVGSDYGRYLWKSPLGAAVDCRNVAEDYDAFHDGDGCPEPDNDYDNFPDGTDDCPATDGTVGPDGISDTIDDTVLYLVPYQAREDFDGIIDWDGCHDSPNDDYDGDGAGDETEVFTMQTDPVNPDTDADTVIDGTDNCPNWPNTAQNVPTWVIPANDSDCDGFNKIREQWVGTDPTKHCNATTFANDEAVDFWPTDFNDSRFTSLADVVLMGPVYNQATGSDPAKKRFDLNASGVVSLADVVLMGPFYNKGCG